ncbi:hypothetical protein [Fulvivirga lutimaris]|uniref:hypothetical protein n=1 Tax=Fulvivirga lutimaris TaxID=1819566 RepID=UPI001C86F682|nr:hypothetical protein [Fulvivirga lutimaris]
MSRFSISFKLKTRKINSILLVGLAFFASCTTPQENAETIEEGSDLNPAAEGFKAEESDVKAIAWADAVMTAQGGRKQWDQTRFIQWNFFGRRDLLWDKATGRVRIDSPKDSVTFLVNVNDETGKVLLKGKEVQDADSLKNLVSRAKSIWINDSYWLVMPFKLKDSGVTLKYLREDTTAKGEMAHVLQLSFEEVGDTPENKYEVFITEKDSLVKQWSYYAQASQDSASAVWPWDNYKEYNGLMLSADRSDNKGPHDVKIFDQVPDAAFENFDWKSE